MVYIKQNKKESDLFWPISIAIFFIMLLIVAYVAHYDEKYPMQCVSSSKVADILSLDYRSATIKLENGKEVVVNQATLKKGDDFCLAHERKK